MTTHAGGESIHNPSSGETIVIRKSAEQTGGQLLAWDLRLAPGGKVPSGHTHPLQEERFTVQSGRLRFRVGGRVVIARAGQTVVVPPGTPHHFANTSSNETVVYVETRPALRMEDMLRTAAGLAQDEQGKARVLPRPVDLMLFMREFQAEVTAPHLPARLVQAVIGAGARLAQWASLDRRYRRLRACLGGTADSR